MKSGSSFLVYRKPPAKRVAALLYLINLSSLCCVYYIHGYGAGAAEDAGYGGLHGGVGGYGGQGREFAQLGPVEGFSAGDERECGQTGEIIEIRHGIERAVVKRYAHYIRLTVKAPEEAAAEIAVIKAYLRQ